LEDENPKDVWLPAFSVSQVQIKNKMFEGALLKPEKGEKLDL